MTNTIIRRQLIGEVVSDKMDKTRVVSVTRSKRHPKYQKFFKVTNRFHAHDESNQYKVGDKVAIAQTRPLSRRKRWEIIAKA